MEMWKPIEETNGDYEVSDLGRVRNAKTGIIRKPKTLPNGYMRIKYMVSCKTLNRYVHRLVANAFCNHPEGCDVVNHIDNDKKNNKAVNLEWTTQKENVYHGMRQKRYHWNAIGVIATKDGAIYKFPSVHQAEIITGCNHSSIVKCCKGERKSFHGYQWKYAEVV